MQPRTYLKGEATDSIPIGFASRPEGEQMGAFIIAHRQMFFRRSAENGDALIAGNKSNENHLDAEHVAHASGWTGPVDEIQTQLPNTDRGPATSEQGPPELHRDFSG